MSYYLGGSAGLVVIKSLPAKFIAEVKKYGRKETVDKKPESDI
jgi:hypothetical protein